MTFVAGAVVGAAVALLVAPYSGTETRRRLGETARRLQNNAKNTIHDMKERLDHTAEHMRDAVSEGRAAYLRSSRAAETRENV